MLQQNLQLVIEMPFVVLIAVHKFLPDDKRNS